MKLNRRQSIVDPQAQFLYDIATTARLLSTTVWAVRVLIREGKLRYVKVGHAYLISPGAIHQFVFNNEMNHDEHRNKQN